MAALRDVFGIHNPAPQYTYVDRDGLDQRMKYFITTGRHLVIYGPSKQGKSALRKRAIRDDDYLVIQCRTRPTINQLYAEVLAALKTIVETSRTTADTKEISGGTEAKTNAGFFSIISAEVKATGGGKTNWQTSSTGQIVGAGPTNIRFVAEAITASNKRLVLEDFHYVPEEEKKTLANDLKALYELHVPVILIGAWEQQQLLPQYNGDLAGRVDELNVRWMDSELRKVIEKGEIALNVKFSRDLKDFIVNDASGNVGLLQRISERICFSAQVLSTQIGKAKQIRRMSFLEDARKSICLEEAARYRAFGWSVAEGFPKSNNTFKKLYMYLIQICVEAKDPELLAGLPVQLIEDRVKSIDPSIKSIAIVKALGQIDKLQSEKSIYPVICTYNPVNKVLHLVDRELLFYRRHGGPNWPWEGENEEE